MISKRYESTEVDRRAWLHVPSGTHWSMMVKNGSSGVLPSSHNKNTLHQKLWNW